MIWCPPTPYGVTRSFSNSLHDLLKLMRVFIAGLINLFRPSNLAAKLQSERFELLGNERFLAGDIDKAVAFWTRSNRVRRVARRRLMPGKIRLFGHDYTQAVGHIGLLANHVKMRELGWIDPETQFCIFAPPGRTANRSLLNYYNRFAAIIEDPVLCRAVEPIRDLCSEPLSVVNDGDGKEHFLNHMSAKIESAWLAAGRGPVLELTDGHRERGWKILSPHINGASKFVVAHIRERGFSSLGGTVVELDSIRNSVIETYIPAFQRLVDQGYAVIRMGDPTLAPLRPMEGVFDYAHSSIRADWVDVFLWAEARFMIATQSGPNVVTNLFGTRNVDVNWAPPAVRPFNASNIFIPKMLREKGTGNILPFLSQISLPLGYLDEITQFERLGLEVVDNTSDEIETAVVEMLHRIEGRWIDDADDIARQKRYDELCVGAGGYVGAPMGRAFLAKHAMHLNQNAAQHAYQGGLAK